MEVVEEHSLMIAGAEAGLHEPAPLGWHKDRSQAPIGEDQAAVLGSLPCCGTDLREAYLDGLPNIQATLPITGEVRRLCLKAEPCTICAPTEGVVIHHLR